MVSVFFGAALYLRIDYFEFLTSDFLKILCWRFEDERKCRPWRRRGLLNNVVC